MQIGYALYSAREAYHDPASLRHVLEQVAEMGYDGVEFFHYADTPAAELADTLRRCGLEAISTHVHEERWATDAAGEVAYAAEAGIPRLVFPWLAPEKRTEAVYSVLPNKLRDLAVLCAGQNIQLYYHNHDFEFQQIDGVYVLDLLLAACGDCALELDTFWTHYAGLDPVAYMRRQGNRLDLVHIKDYTDLTTDPPAFCAIGTGKMQNAPVIREAEETGKAWLIVELDNSPIDPLESARISLDYVKQVLGRGKT